MYKRPLLCACILYESPLDSEVSKKLFQYLISYKLVIHIDIGDIHPTRKVICIPKASCDPILNTDFSFIIQTQDQLYGILVNLVCLALNHLNKTCYQHTGDTLTISVPSTATDDRVYTFGWRLDFQNESILLVKTFIYQAFIFFYAINLYLVY